MANWYSNKKEDLELEEVELEEEEEILEPEDDDDNYEEEDVEVGGYIAVRRITYAKVRPPIEVKPGKKVPDVIINNPALFNNLLSKGAIEKE